VALPGPDELPFIDAHETLVRAAPAAVWDATADVVAGWGGPVGAIAARAVGCSDTESDFPRTVVGFRVVRADRPSVISLRGAHRFSRYALEFSIGLAQEGQTRLRAQSWAEFPGIPGRIYRAGVIGTGGHVFAVRRLLGAIQRRAERS
jgi:hypothetical protein